MRVIAKRSQATVKLEKLGITDGVMWRQKAKAFWVKEEDIDTRMFQEMANGRRNKIFLHGLDTNEGNILEVDNRLEDLAILLIYIVK